MPSQEVEFDQLLTTIEADYVAPADYNEHDVRGWCDHIAEEDRGKFEIGYELDVHGFGNKVLTQITYIPLTTADEVWFTTTHQVADIVPAPPPWDQAPDDAAEDEGPLPALPRGHRRTGAVLPDGEDLPVGPMGHRRTGALEPTPHAAQLAAQSQDMAQPGAGVPAGPVPATLHAAMVSPEWWNAYLDYATQRHMAENAQFVADLGAYMSNATWEYFDWMVTVYIRESSSRMININSANRLKLTQLSDDTSAAARQQQSGPGVNVFQDAYVEVYSDMLEPDYNAFKKLHGG